MQDAVTGRGSFHSHERDEAAESAPLIVCYAANCMLKVRDSYTFTPQVRDLHCTLAVR